MTDEAFGQPIHATAVMIDGRGVLITGQAGSGKTSLGLTLIRRARGGDLKAGLIADDRVTLTRTGGHIIANCPAQIWGKVEARGYGIADATAIMAAPAPLELIVELVHAAQAPRYQVDDSAMLEGLPLTALKLPAGPPPTAPTAIFAALGLPVWL